MSGDGPAITALKRGFELYKANATPLIVGAGIWLLGIGAISAILNFIILRPLFVRPRDLEDILSGRGSFGFAFGGSLLVSAILAGLVMVLAIIAANGMINAALKLHDTGTVEVGDFFKFRNLGQTIILALVLGLATAVTQILIIVPMAISLFTMFAIFLVVDRNQGFWDAIMNSSKHVASNFVQSLLIFLLAGIVGSIGVIACGIGIIATLPIGLMALTVFYRTLGEAPADFKFQA